MRGQGATEYLIILGVVLVIGLVVISLLGFFPGTAGETSMTESQIYWSTARPFAIQDATADSAIGCAATGGGYRLVVHNTELGKMVLRNLTMDGTARNFCVANSTSPATSITFGISEKKTIVVEYKTSSECPSGQFGRKDLSLAFDSEDATGQVQKGTKKLIVRCP